MSSLNKHLMRMKTITRNFKWTWKKSGQGKLLFSPLPLFCFFSWWEKSKELVHITCGFWISLCWKTFFFLKLSEVLKIFVRLMSGVCFHFRGRTCFLHLVCFLVSLQLHGTCTEKTTFLSKVFALVTFEVSLKTSKLLCNIFLYLYWFILKLLFWA